MPASPGVDDRPHPGVAHVWPSVTYHTLLDRTPQLIGAPTVWGPTLATAGQGMKIAIVDDGIDQTHPFFAPAGFAYPAGFPKGQTAYTTPKVIVARAFAPATPRLRATRQLPFDPELSDHGTMWPGIAAGDNNTTTRTGVPSVWASHPAPISATTRLSAIPSQFGANGNSPELAAAIEAAVRDGMDVINLSLGETEIDPSRDVVVSALNAAADAGVVSAVSAGNDFEQYGYGTITSPANAAKAISVAASSGGHGSPDVDSIASFSSAGPDALFADVQAGRHRPGRRRRVSRARRQLRRAQRHEHVGTARRGSGGRAAPAAPDLDAGTGQVGTRADGRSSSQRQHVRGQPTS